jgi:lactaldehyde reductase
VANRIVLNTISYHGEGAIDEISGEIGRRGYAKVFVCSDPDLVKFGVTDKVTQKLDAAGIPWSLYSEIKPNPTIKNVQDGVAAFQASGADCIVAIGGGSSMDTAKGIGIIATNPEFADVRSLEGVAPTKNHAVFTIAVPTTAGTAAEVTINYVITDPEKKRKFVCVDTNDIPEVACVDPAMMASMPVGLTASTGMDALTHAIEGYTTKAAWQIPDMFHLEAIRLISENLRDAVAEAKSGTPGTGREAMALGQYIAGMGFSNVGLGIAHSMAHCLGANYDTPHGVACAMMLPNVMEYNAPVCPERMRDVAVAMGVEGAKDMTPEAGAAAAVAAVRQLGEDVGIPKVVEALKEADLDRLAADTLADACCPGNPRDATADDVKDLFRKVMR